MTYNDGYMSLIHFSKSIKFTPPKVNPNVNQGIWVIMKRKSGEMQG